MLNRVTKKHNKFYNNYVINSFSSVVKQLLKIKRPLTIYLVANQEYTYKMSGRCMSFRSRGKIANLLIRNYSYGVEQRIFINNPRLGIYVLQFILVIVIE
jgi:hypothetical protein